MNFDATRLHRSDRIVGAGAILFFVFLFFFKWYGVSTSAPSIGGVNLGGTFSFNGWHTFSVNRWLWLLTIVVALAAVGIRAGVLKLEPPVQPAVATAVLGALSTLTILYRILDHPTFSASFAGVHTSVGIKIGIWLGLVAAVAITYGGYLGMQDEGTSLADVRDQAAGAIGGLAGPSPTADGGAAGAAQESAPPSPPASTEPPTVEPPGPMPA